MHKLKELINLSNLSNFQLFASIVDIASQSIDNSWRKSKKKFTEFYDN